jgi:hypothetical protein
MGKLLNVTQAGMGTVYLDERTINLTVPAATRTAYANAQVTSYHNRHDFSYTPPLRMEVIAWGSGDFRGTAGFGFWNHPFAPNERVFRVPKAIWFFHASPPNNMALAKGIPGYGWKAATFDATRPQFLALLPTAPIGFLLMRIPAVYRRLWGVGQRAIGVSEVLLDPKLLSKKSTYAIDWLPEEITFSVDGAVVHQVKIHISGKLGFVAWVDNQYAVVTPQGQFGWGLVDAVQPQNLTLEDLKITTQ